MRHNCIGLRLFAALEWSALFHAARDVKQNISGNFEGWRKSPFIQEMGFIDETSDRFIHATRAFLTNELL